MSLVDNDSKQVNHYIMFNLGLDFDESNVYAGWGLSENSICGTYTYLQLRPAAQFKYTRLN